MPDRNEGMLARLDTVGLPHRNPNGRLVPTPHLHKYLRGYDSGAAHPIKASEFRDIGDILKSYDDFCTLFNVVRRPRLLIEG